MACLDSTSSSSRARLAFPIATRGRSCHPAQLTPYTPGRECVFLVTQCTAHALHAWAEMEKREEGGSGAEDTWMKGQADNLFVVWGLSHSPTYKKPWIPKVLVLSHCYLLTVRPLICTLIPGHFTPALPQTSYNFFLDIFNNSFAS